LCDGGNVESGISVLSGVANFGKGKRFLLVAFVLCLLSWNPGIRANQKKQDLKRELAQSLHDHAPAAKKSKPSLLEQAIEDDADVVVHSSKWSQHEVVIPKSSLLDEALADHVCNNPDGQSKWPKSPVSPLAVSEKVECVVRSPRGVKLKDGQIDFDAFAKHVKK
jgi:hypothetical protein